MTQETTGIECSNPSCRQPLEKRGGVCPGCGVTATTTKMTANAVVNMSVTVKLTIERVASMLTTVVAAPTGFADLTAAAQVLAAPRAEGSLDETALAMLKNAPSLTPLIKEFYGLPTGEWLRWVRVLVIVVTPLAALAKDNVTKAGGLGLGAVVKHALDEAIKKADEQDKRDGSG